MFKNLNNKGYNLMELIVVIIIIGVLIAMAVPKYLDHKKQADLAVIQNDSKVVQNVAMTEYMSTDKLPKGEDKKEDYFVEHISKGKVFRNGKLVESKDQIGTNPKVEIVRSGDLAIGGDIYVSRSQNIEDYWLLDDTWVRANTKSALPGRFLLDSDFNVYYVAKGGFGSGGIWGGGGSGNGGNTDNPGETDKPGESGNTNTQDDLIKEIEEDLKQLEKDIDEDKKSDKEIQEDIGKIQDKIDKVENKNDKDRLQKELDRLKDKQNIKEIEKGLADLQENADNGKSFEDVEDKVNNIQNNIDKVEDEDKQKELQDELGKIIVELKSGFKVKQVALGGGYSAAITEDGSLWTWGYGGYGKLGHGDEKLNNEASDGNQYQTVPKKVSYFSGKNLKVKQVALGVFHSAAITEDGSLWTWGWNEFGQLGHGDEENKDKPTKVKIKDGDKTLKVEQVALRVSHSAAITEDGSLYTWGRGGSGRLGHGGTDNKDKPTKVKDISNVKQVALGKEHSAAITEDGSLYTWGYGGSGRLGHGNSNSIDIPKKVEIKNGEKVLKVKQVALGEHHSAVVAEDGSLYTWGYGGSGQLGHGDDDKSNKYRPTKVTGISKVKQVALGSFHSAAITEDVSLYTWGEGDNGRLGYGGTDNKDKPTKVKDISNVKQVALGYSHSAAITEDGSLYTWGSGSSGKLGHGDEEDRYEPKKVEKYVK